MAWQPCGWRGWTHMMSDKQSTRAAILIVILLFATIPCTMAGWFYHDYLASSEFQTHGQRAEAQVLDIYPQMRHHRHSADTCAVIADYRFTPNGSAHSLTGKDSIGACDQPGWSNPWLAHVTKTHEMPVAYDVTNPQVSRENFDDYVFRLDTKKTFRYRLMVLGVSVLIGGIFGVLACFGRNRKTPTSPSAV